jgi:hypothetical protein
MFWFCQEQDVTIFRSSALQQFILPSTTGKASFSSFRKNHPISLNPSYPFKGLRGKLTIQSNDLKDSLPGGLELLSGDQTPGFCGKVNGIKLLPSWL